MQSVSPGDSPARWLGCGRRGGSASAAAHAAAGCCGRLAALDCWGPLPPSYFTAACCPGALPAPPRLACPRHPPAGKQPRANEPPTQPLFEATTQPLSRPPLLDATGPTALPPLHRHLPPPPAAMAAPEPPLITLNVGGQLFMALRATLRSRPGSLLSAMFSGE